MSMVVSRLGLKPDVLRGETVIITGAGGGIGYEAARSLLWLGANVILAGESQARLWLAGRGAGACQDSAIRQLSWIRR